MDKQLAMVKWTEILWLRVAKPDYAEQFVARGIHYRHRVGELLSRVDAVAMADGDIRVRSRAWRLSRVSGRHCDLGNKTGSDQRYDCSMHIGGPTKKMDFVTPTAARFGPT